MVFRILGMSDLIDYEDGWEGFFLHGRKCSVLDMLVSRYL